MKYAILIAALLVYLPATQAQKLISKSGHVQFYSHTPVEDIEAHNRQVVSILDTESGAVEFKLLVKSFEFEKKMMQEHFNENYMESDKFPKSSFSGVIDGPIPDFKKDGTYPVDVSGKLTLHGVSNQIKASGTISIEKGIVTARSKFNINPDDYNIAIPDVVKDKIAKEIEVSVNIPYSLN